MPQNPSFPWLKSYPQDVDWLFAPHDRPLYEILEIAAQEHGDASALHFLGRQYTYRDLQDGMNRIASGLQERGVVKGTRVGLLLPNTPAYVLFYYGILKAGGCVVNFSPLYAEQEIAHQLQDSGTQILVTLDLKFLYAKVYPLLEKKIFEKLIICPLKDQLTFPRKLLFPLLKARDLAKIHWDNRHISLASLLLSSQSPRITPINPSEDVAVLQYTGGTTGIPKGAMLTHRNVYSNMLQCFQYVSPALRKEGKILAALPFFHVFAMTAVLNLGIKCGFELILCFPRFEVIEALRLIQKHGITMIFGVPTLFNRMVNHPKASSYDLSSLTFCISGGAPLPKELQEQFQNLSQCPLVEGYGLSETSPVATLNPLFNKRDKTPSIGLPLPGTRIKITSLETLGQEVPLGHKGEICIQGPQVMKGYWKDEEGDKFDPSSKEEAFFHTGDIGYMDEDGYVYVMDRLKDLILCNGYNIYPRHVERAIYRHPAVEDVIVIGVDDESHGAVVKAFIKLREGEIISQEDLSCFLKDKLSPLERPKYIEFRESLPRTPLGKLSKKELLLEEKKKQISSVASHLSTTSDLKSVG